MLLVKSLLLAASTAACQSFNTSSLRQPLDALPSEFSLLSAPGDDVDVEAIHDSMSDFPIGREVECFETRRDNFDGDSL